MIRSDAEYSKAITRLKEEKARIGEMARQLAEKGLKPEEIKRAIDPIESFHLQFAEEVENYSKLKRGEFDELINFRGFGHSLISARIAMNISQTELAKRLGVSDSQVSRDEKNEYHNITLERATKIIEALGIKVSSKIEMEQPRQAS